MTKKKTWTMRITPLQVREAIMGWALDHQTFPPHWDFDDTHNATVTLTEDGGANIKVVLTERTG